MVNTFCTKSNPFLYDKTRIPLIICLMNMLWLRMCSGSHLARLLICTLGLGCVFCSFCLVETGRPVLSMPEVSPVTSDHIPECHDCSGTAVSLLLLSGTEHHPRQDAEPLALPPWDGDSFSWQQQSGLISQSSMPVSLRESQEAP